MGEEHTTTCPCGRGRVGPIKQSLPEQEDEDEQKKDQTAYDAADNGGGMCRAFLVAIVSCRS